MSEAFWLKFLDSFPAILGAVTLGVLSILTYIRAGRAIKQSENNAAKISNVGANVTANTIKITEVGDAVNGKMERLIEVSNAASKFEAALQEKERFLEVSNAAKFAEGVLQEKERCDEDAK